MKRSFNPTLSQTLLLAGSGVLLVTFSFLLPSLFYARFHQSTVTNRLLLILPPFLLGSAIALLAILHLRRRIRTRTLPSSDIEALRTMVTSTLWTRLHTSVPILAMIFMVVAFVSDRHRNLAALGYGALMLSTAMTLSKSSVAKTPEAQPPLPAPAAPLRSDHWGQH